VAPTTAISRSSASRAARERDLSFARRVRTTPGQLRAASVILIAAVFVLGGVVMVASAARSSAARSFGRDAADLVAAQHLYAELAAADAAASASYLSAGLEPPELRRRYVASLAAAGERLEQVARAAESSPGAHRAVRTISKHLPEYAGLIESARANDRQGFTVGAAYLRQASRLMREELIPAATAVYEDTSHRLAEAFDQGTSPVDVALVLVAGGISIMLLVVVQVLVTRRTHRLMNIGLVLATVIVVIVVGWTIGRLAAEQSALEAARREGSDAVQVFSAMRILALRAHNDDNLVLIDRGGGEQYVSDYEAIERRLEGAEGNGGLMRLADAVATGENAADRVEDVRAQLAAFTEAHGAVREHDDAGAYEEAVSVAVTREADAARALDDTLRTEVDRAGADLLDRSADARSGFALLVAAGVVLSLIAAGLVLVGLQPRIEEYR
jgi:hypothetical protein